MRKMLSLFLLLTLLLNCPTSFGAPDTATEEKPKGPPPEDPYQQMELLVQVMELVRKNYVDDHNLTYQRLVRGALKGMLHDLDAFSAYEDPEVFKKTMEHTAGKYVGIGVVLVMKAGDLQVVGVMENSPASKAGILTGDIILEIEDKPTRLMNMKESVGMLKGKPGTEVNITLYRRTDDETKQVTVTRQYVKVPSVRGVQIIDDGIGYLWITEFSAVVPEELDEALLQLKEQGMKGLIIDLRNNPGGLLKAAVEVCSRFLKEGEKVVFTVGRANETKEQYFSKECDNRFLDLPLVILINENSASASEIVSACLQDHKRAVLVGELSFGKGSVQTVIGLGDQGAIRFTTAKYYTPSEKVIHGNGVKPDIVVDVSPNTSLKLARQRNGLPGQIMPDIPKAIKDVQLERAVEILKGICLFGRSSD